MGARRTAALLALAALAAGGVLAVTAWRSGEAAPKRLTVYAAASLGDVLPKIDPAPRYSFGGSNTLAAQIRQGAPADVFASANTKIASELHAAGLCSKPAVLARNALVIVVPKANPAKIRDVRDLTRPGVKVVVAGAGVPAGDYTLQALKRLRLASAVTANVVSREADVREVLAKVALGEADAGFVYTTDAKAAAGRVAVLRLPSRAQPEVRYGICVVDRDGDRSGAEAFVRRALGPAGQAKLTAAGFLPARR